MTAVTTVAMSDERGGKSNISGGGGGGGDVRLSHSSARK